MNVNRDKRIVGEYDPPLPERIQNPTKADLEKLEELKAKYKRMKENRLKA